MILKLFCKQKVSGIVKIDEGQRKSISNELVRSPKFLAILINNLNYLVNMIDDRMLDCSTSANDYAVSMAELMGQKKAYKHLLMLLTEQPEKENQNDR